MNGDALSDLVLALVCGWIAWRERKERPGLALGVAIVGVAAVFGVLRFSGLAQMKGPHTFFSTVSACGGLPLLATALRWPEGAAAREPRAAARFLLITGMLSVVLVTVAGFGFWRQLAPGAAGLVILVTAVQSRSPMAIIGALLLAASFAVTATGAVLGPFNSTQGLHYLMAAAFILLSLPVAARVSSTGNVAAAS